jgi:hypothetical protein
MNTTNKFNYYDYKFLFFLLILFLTPYFSYVFLQLSSLSEPLFIITIIYFALHLREIFDIKLDDKTYSIILIFIFYILIRTLNDYFFNFESKPIKAVPLFLTFLLSFVIYNYINESTFSKVYRIFFIFFTILSSLAWLDFFYHFPLFNFNNYLESIFPFVEPSHFALVYGMIGIPLIVDKSFKLNIFVLANYLFFSITLPSTTLSLFFILTLILFIIKKENKLQNIFGITIFLLIIIFFFKSYLNISYFESRLGTGNFETDDAFNWTRMVYLQGWELMMVNLLSTNFLGLGYQMMGSAQTATGDISKAIFEFSGQFGKNIADGSFIMSKLVSEFGIIGIFITFIYIKFIFNFFLNFNKKYLKVITEKDLIKKELLQKDIFCNVIILSFSINFVFRGINYFTPQSILLVAAIIFVTKNKEKIKNYI